MSNQGEAIDPLTTLAEFYDTDKGSHRPGFHGYTKAYHEHFGASRSAVKSVLEIGVLNGASLRMWRDYFPNAQIFGIDHAQEVSRESLDELSKEKRISVTIGKQDNPIVLAKMVANSGGFDLVIDDGSHVAADYLSTLWALWKHVRRWYVIEDVHDRDLNYALAVVECGAGCSAKLIPSTHPDRNAILICDE